MRLYSTHYSLFLFGLFFVTHSSRPPASYPVGLEPTCAFPDGRPAEIQSESATCYGYSPCNACKDCSRCRHCNSGGSCGMCSGGSVPNYRNSSSSGAGSTRSRSTTRSNYNSSSYSASNTSVSRTTVYLPVLATVAVETLNVRSGPGTEFEILAELTKGDEVTITETAGENWVKIEVLILDGNETSTLEGYVFRKYLSY